MEQKELYEFIKKMNPSDYAAVKEMIAKEEKKNYDEMWWNHDRIDNYLYYVYYDDGTQWMHCIAKKVYDEYIKNEKAICIKRKTKDLFPTWETMLTKERNEA